MKIHIESHTLARAKERGTDEEEIRDVIGTGIPITAKYGRIGKAKIYNYKRKWLNKYYEQKRVEVIYTIEKNVIITITVHVFYGKWEDIDEHTI